jgi:hypothetical protein
VLRRRGVLPSYLLEELVLGRTWWEVYDLCEAFVEYIAKGQKYSAPMYRRLAEQSAAEFQKKLDDAMKDLGLGWQMEHGRVVAREDGPIEALLGEAGDALAGAKLGTSAEHLAQARADLSRRPKPDLTGCVHHSIAALEAVARECSGDAKATLGQVIERHAEQLGIRPPLDQALIKLWGFSSEEGGRHGREGSEPTRREAVLLFGFAASMIAFLASGEDS